MDIIKDKQSIDTQDLLHKRKKYLYSHRAYMRRHCIGIKEIYGQQYTSELLRQSDNEAALRNFLRTQNIIIVQCESYNDQPETFGNIYADIAEENTKRSIVWSRWSISEACDFLHFIGFHVQAINSYTQSITNEQAVALIHKSVDNTKQMFALLQKKSQQTQTHIAQSFQDAEQTTIHHIIDRALSYIREAITIGRQENKPQTKDLIIQLQWLEEELVRNRRSTNIEKNKQSISEAMHILDQLEFIHIQNNPNDPLFAGTHIGSRDLELMYSAYTRKDIRHPDQKPHLSTYDKVIIMTQFARQDLLYTIQHKIGPDTIMYSINQCVYISIALYVIYGIIMIAMEPNYIQTWTYNLINIWLLWSTRHIAYKIYQTQYKNIYIILITSIIIRQLVSRFIYSYIAL